MVSKEIKIHSDQKEFINILISFFTLIYMSILLLKQYSIQNEIFMDILQDFQLNKPYHDMHFEICSYSFSCDESATDQRFNFNHKIFFHSSMFQMFNDCRSKGKKTE